MRKLIPLSFFFLIFMNCIQLFAQESQYQRKKEVSKPTPSSTTTETKPNSSTDKIDVEELEQKYWAPKDTDFTVVQNRTYKKEKRFSGTFSFGPIINDSYSRGTNLGLGANYYFSEREGVEMNLVLYNLGDNVMTKTFISRYGTIPNHNKAKQFIGGAYNWIPIYAKVSLLGQKILYFDMIVSPGLGLTTYDQILESGRKAQTAATLTLDFTQLLFLGENLAFRLDAKNQFYQEKIVEYDTGAIKRSGTAHNFLLMFGITYFH